MRKAIYLLLITFVIYSCKKNNETTENYRPQISQEIIKQNLENDINDYFLSLFEGNIDKGFNYLHESNIRYLKKEFPNEYNDDVPKQIIQMTSKQLAIFKDSLGAKLDFKVEKLDEKVNNKDYIIYMYKSKLLASKKNDTIKTDTYVLGISENGGNSFKFLQADDKEYLKEILKVSFDNETIQKIDN